MAQYIDKELIKQEIERQIGEGKVKCKQSQENNDYESYIAWSEHVATCGKLLLFIDSLSEEPVSEDLEEEFHSWMRENCDNNGFFNQLELACHFAEWQREKDIKLEKIDDLEEFAQKWAYSNYHKELDGVNCDCLYSGVIKGAEWQKQQMMKDTVELTITNTSFIPLPKLDIKAGDKVKIIICKTE